MSNTVIATTPLPVHRSAIRRPIASPVFFQDIDEHPGVFLGGVHALCRDHNVALVGVCG
jgi:hypothetical protein